MNALQLKQTLELLEIVYKNDRAVNKATRAYYEIISPGEYAPVIEWKLSSILNYIKIENPEIAELLEYYFFESKNMNGGGMIESNGKKYKYDNHESIIESMVDFWYIK